MPSRRRRDRRRRRRLEGVRLGPSLSLRWALESRPAARSSLNAFVSTVVGGRCRSPPRLRPHARTRRPERSGAAPSGRLHLVGRSVGRIRRGQNARPDQTAERRSHQRGDPEHPELAERARLGEEGHGGGPRRIDRGVRHRNGDQVDQRQPEADRDRREAGRRLGRGRAEDDDQEPGGQDHFDQQCRHQSVAARRKRAEPVGGEAPGRPARRTGCDGVEEDRGDEPADDLRDPVERHLGPGEAAADREAERHGRVEVAAGDVADRVGHRQDREAEGERDAHEADAQFGKAGGEDGTAATAEYEPEGAEGFGCEFLDHLGLFILSLESRTIRGAARRRGTPRFRVQAAASQLDFTESRSAICPYSDRRRRLGMKPAVGAVSFVLRVGWLSRLPLPLRSALLDVAWVRNYSAGETLYAGGDPSGGLYGLESGSLALEGVQSDSPPQKSFLVHPGAWIGEGPVCGLETRMTGALATRPSAVVAIEVAACRRVAARAPDLWRHIALLSLRNHARTIGLAQDLMLRAWFLRERSA